MPDLAFMQTVGSSDDGSVPCLMRHLVGGKRLKQKGNDHAGGAEGEGRGTLG